MQPLLQHTIASEKQEEDRKKGIIISLMVHVFLLLLALIPAFIGDTPQKEIAGIMVSFGTPDGGSDNTNPLSDSEAETDNVNPDDEKEKSASNSEKATSPQKEKIETKPKTENMPVEDIKAEVEEAELIAKEAQIEEEKSKAELAKEAEANATKKAAEELARKEAAKKAEEKAKKEKYDESKKQFSDLFGSGAGNNNNSGNQGTPDGDPNTSALDNIATGSGRIGGGLANRSVTFEPVINDNSQKIGKVVIKVCVDRTGAVQEAKFTQRGSTTTDKYLVDLATKGAKKYKFSPSDVELQCGTITVEFKVE